MCSGWNNRMAVIMCLDIHLQQPSPPPPLPRPPGIEKNPEMGWARGGHGIPDLGPSELGKSRNGPSTSNPMPVSVPGTYGKKKAPPDTYQGSRLF